MDVSAIERENEGGEVGKSVPATLLIGSMPKQHTVIDGEGLASIAEYYGLAPQTIWQDAANANLRSIRPDANILAPGDVLTIPDKVRKEVAVPTGATHRFRRVGVPAMFRMQLFMNREPRANVSFLLNVDGTITKGTTDENGMLCAIVPTAARRGQLTIENEAPLHLLFGSLEPATVIRGVQQRLCNLAFLRESPTGYLNDATRAALEAFQEMTGLEITGEPDDATIKRLRELHDYQDTFTRLPKDG